jgi:cysteine synthase
VVLTPAHDGMAGAMRRYEEITHDNPDAWLPRQFDNPDNIAASSAGFAKEILYQTNGCVDIFVAGIGTGGTLLGVAKALRRANPEVRIIAVEPAESAVLSGHKTTLNAHRVQGIGVGFVPPLIAANMRIIDETITITGNDAVAMSNRLAQRHGLWVVGSSRFRRSVSRSLFHSRCDLILDSVDWPIGGFRIGRLTDSCAPIV